MGRIERILRQAELDAERDKRLERESKEADARRTEQPKDNPK